MKKIVYTIAIVLFVVNFCFSQVVSYKIGDIYNYNIGDTFQYKYGDPSYGACRFDAIKQVVIKNKWISGDTIYYTQEVISKIIYFTVTPNCSSYPPTFNPPAVMNVFTSFIPKKDSIILYDACLKSQSLRDTVNCQFTSDSVITSTAYLNKPGEKIMGNPFYEILYVVGMGAVDYNFIPDGLVAGAYYDRLVYYRSDALNETWGQRIANSFNVGINDVSDKEFKLYPNPAISTLHLTIEDNKKYEVVFYNLMGQKIHAAQIENTAQIDVCQWERGIYFYQISDKNGIASSGKVMKE